MSRLLPLQVMSSLAETSGRTVLPRSWSRNARVALVSGLAFEPVSRGVKARPRNHCSENFPDKRSKMQPPKIGRERVREALGATTKCERHRNRKRTVAASAEQKLEASTAACICKIHTNHG
jgi:hypothetical protein